MAFVDGSNAANQAFSDVLKVVNKNKDHIFLVTIRERPISELTKGDLKKTLLGYKLWTVANEIIKPYTERLEKENYNYTVVLPQADDAKELAVALSKRYKVDFCYVGKHQGDETKHHHHHSGLPGIPGFQKVFFKIFAR